MKSLIFAIIALVLVVVGWVVPAISLFTGIAAFVFAIIAYVTGKNMLKADPSDGKAKAGKIIGLILMILAIIGIIMGIIAFAGLMMLGAMLAG